MRRSLFTTLRNGFANPLPLTEACERWSALRIGMNFLPGTPPLLTWPRGNTKLRKTGEYGLCLLPHRLSGTNLCPHSTPGCRAVCLNSAGRGAQNSVQKGRLARSRLLLEEPAAFAAILGYEIGKLPTDTGVRLNVLSDIKWEELWPEIFASNPTLSFYDYTKYPRGARNPPPNYHLTYSASERWTDTDIVDAVTGGDNVTVVFPVRRKEALPSMWNGLPVIDGDLTDRRSEDPVGCVVGLRAKGDAYGGKADSDFVRSL